MCYRQLPRLLGLCLALLAGSASAQGEIPWLSDLYQAKLLAQQQQRLLLLHFYTDWCAPCRKLDRDVFPRLDVVRAVSNNYVPVKVNADRFKDLAREYSVDRFPTDVIADVNGRVLDRRVTSQDPVQYATLLERIAADYRGGMQNYALAGRTPSPDAARFGVLQPARERVEPGYQSGAGRSAGSAYYDASYRNPPGGEYPTNGFGSPTNVNNDFANQTPYNAAPAGRYANGERLQSPGGNWAPPNVNYPAANPGTPPPNGNVYETRPQTNPYVGGAPPANYDAPGQDGQRWRSGWASHNGTAGYDSRGTAPQPAAQAGSQPWQPRAEASGREPAPRIDVAQNKPRDERTEPPLMGPAANTPAPPHFGLDSFCPVTLAEEERWQKGDPRWGAIHRGHTYLFASQQQQQKFLADPDRYAPVLAGCDAVRLIDGGETTPGNRRHGVWFKGRIYLFADAASRDRFEHAADFYAQKTHEAMMASR
jgi:thioredoxin-related protein